MDDNLTKFNELNSLEKYNVLILFKKLHNIIEICYINSSQKMLTSNIISYNNAKLKYNIKFDYNIYKPKGIIEIEYVLLYSYYDKIYIDIKSIQLGDIDKINKSLKYLKRLIKIEKILNK